MKLRTGATLQSGKYLLNQVLDSAGIGTTFLATQTLLNQVVVIKTLDPSLLLSHNFLQLRDRFTQEARLLARIQHPSIVRVLDFFQEETLPFLVMEHVPGKSLASLVAANGSLSEAEAIHYVRQVGTALHLAHQNGLIHRNLKPASIIRRQGTNLGVLVGFGLAHELVSTQDKDDLHALAATLYHLLSGRTPTANLLIDAAPWSPTTKQAILLGLRFEGGRDSRSIEDWLRLLPNTTLPLMGATPPPPLLQHYPVATNGRTATGRTVSGNTSNGNTSNGNTSNGNTSNGKTLPPVPSPQPTVATVALNSPSSRPVTQHPMSANRPFEGTAAGMSRHLPKFLVLTIASTAAMGAGFGLALRISAAKAPGTSILHPTQTFAERDWKGTLSPDPDSNSLPVENALGDFKSKPAPAASESGIPKAPAGWGKEAIPPVVPAPIAEPAPEMVPSVTPQVTPREEIPEPIEPAIVDDPAPYTPPAPAPKPRVAPVTPAPITPELPPVVVPEPIPVAPPSGGRELEPAPPPATSGAGLKTP